MMFPIARVPFACLVTACYCLSAITVRAEPDGLPMPQREFRAAWVATVANIDWPSEPGLSSAAQQAEFTRIVERASELNLNALILQVRAAADAFYASAFEPWSPYLTGTMGQPPQPNYDPLEFAIQAAHEHGIELHVWFNPYRALHKSFKGVVSENHVSKLYPDRVKEYDGYLWLDPGDREASQHSLDVMLDVVRRYDIDGVHMDDYFYPYPVNDEAGKELPFPDDESFAKAQADGYQGARDDWRRQNVDWLVERLHRHTKQMKPWVRVGISPFGIWRPGHPASIKGFDPYSKLYADAKKWLQEGWVDYFTPQLYWSIESEGQSYPELLDWWCEQNTQGKHIWPGNYTSRVGMKEEKNWEPDELLGQIEVTRNQQGASGNVHFSMKALFDDYSDLGSRLKAGPYAKPALVPERADAHEASLATFAMNKEEKPIARTANAEAPWLWVVWTKENDLVSYEIRPSSTELVLDHRVVAVSTVNRDGNMSLPVTWQHN